MDVLFAQSFLSIVVRHRLIVTYLELSLGLSCKLSSSKVHHLFGVQCGWRVKLNVPSAISIDAIVVSRLITFVSLILAKAKCELI